MRHRGSWILAGVFAVAGLGGIAHANHEEKEEGHAHQKVSLSELPSAVRSTFDKEAQGGQIEELRKETKKGKTVYEGEVVSNGKGTNLEVSEGGKVLERSAPHNEATEKEHAR